MESRQKVRVEDPSRRGILNLDLKHPTPVLPPKFPAVMRKGFISYKRSKLHFIYLLIELYLALVFEKVLFPQLISTHYYFEDTQR